MRVQRLFKDTGRVKPQQSEKNHIKISTTNRAPVGFVQWQKPKRELGKYPFQT
jgi:hypothetical protein